MRAWGWPTKLALAVGGAGHLWTLLYVAWPLMTIIWKPPAEDQKPYEIPGNQAYGDVGEMYRRLRGWPVASRKSEGRPCFSGSAECQDAEFLVRGRGPKNGSTATFWIAETVNDQSFVGRYVTDLWYLTQAGTGAIGFSRAIQHGDNTRFVERTSLPPAPPGWRLLQRGQCVQGNMKLLDEQGTIGRFVIDLPEDVRLEIQTGSGGKGKPVPTEEILTFQGREVRRAQDPDSFPEILGYQTEHAGRHELTMSIRQGHVLEAGSRTKYSVMVMWGGCTWGCGFASGDSVCYEGNRDD